VGGERRFDTKKIKQKVAHRAALLGVTRGESPWGSLDKDRKNETTSLERKNSLIIKKQWGLLKEESERMDSGPPPLGEWGKHSISELYDAKGIKSHKSHDYC